MKRLLRAPSWMPAGRKFLARIPPPALVFLASLLLSLVAISGEVTVGKDAAFYLDIAQQVLAKGPGMAFQAFSWPWFSLLLAATHWLFGVSLELAAYLWCAFFMAGTCALLVALTQRFLSGSAYWACLVVLSVPAFNQFRGDILREFGFWFFSMLALWSALRWFELGGWLRAAGIQIAIGCAALFRLEAVMLAPVLVLCLLGELSTRQGWIRLLQLNVLPLAAMALFWPSLIFGGASSLERVLYYASLLDPHNLWLRFNLMANALAESALEKYSTDDARLIIFSGLSTVVLVKFLTLSGPFALPLLFPTNWVAVGAYWRKLKPLAWTCLLYFCVLLLFFVQQRFVNSRYVSFLHWLAVPLLTMATVLFVQRFARFSKAFVVLALAVMLHNVLTFGAKKTHFIEASAWLAEHTQASDAIFYEDSRIAYYAGRGFPTKLPPREVMMLGEQSQPYRYLVIEGKADDPQLQSWMTQRQKRVLAQFANRKGHSLLIIGD